MTTITITDTSRGWVEAQAVTQELLASRHDGRVERHPELSRATIDSPCPYLNGGVPLAPIDAGAPTIEQLCRFFPADGPPALVWDAWGAVDLRAHGWSLMGRPPFMARPAVDHTERRAAVLRIVEVDDAATLADFER